MFLVFSIFQITYFVPLISPFYLLKSDRFNSQFGRVEVCLKFVEFVIILFVFFILLLKSNRFNSQSNKLEIKLKFVKIDQFVFFINRTISPFFTQNFNTLNDFFYCNLSDEKISRAIYANVKYKMCSVKKRQFLI